MNEPQPFNQFTLNGDSSAGAAQTVTKAAIPTFRHYLSRLTVSIVTAPAAIGVVTVDIKSGSNTLYRGAFPAYVAATGTSPFDLLFCIPLQCNTNELLDIVVGSLGSMVSRVSAQGYTAR